MDQQFRPPSCTIRQTPLKGCHGRKVLFREAVFTKPGVPISVWSICDWCALNKCYEGPMEIAINGALYVCNCEAEHDIVIPSNGKTVQKEFLELKSQSREAAEERNFEAKFEARKQIQNFRLKFSSLESNIIAEINQKAKAQTSDFPALEWAEPVLTKE